MRDLAASLEEEPPDLPMTPLIDMVFLLLAFFIFATQLKQDTSAQQVQLPTHQGPDGAGSQASDAWQVEVDKAGQITLLRPNSGGAGSGGSSLERVVIARADQTTMESYLPQLKALAQKQMQDHPQPNPTTTGGPLPPVELRVDQAAPFGRVSEVWAALQLAGFTKIRVPYHLTPAAPQAP